MWDKGKFCCMHRGCYSAQPPWSTLLWWGTFACGCRAALRVVGWVWIKGFVTALASCSASLKDAERAPREASAGRAYRSLLPSSLILRRMQHALTNGETCFLSCWKRNVAAKTEQISDYYALRFEVLDLLSPVKVKSRVSSCPVWFCLLWVLWSSSTYADEHRRPIQK